MRGCPYQKSSLAADLACSFRSSKTRAWAVSIAAMEIDAQVVNESAHRRRRCEWIATVGTVSGPSAAARSAVGARGDEVGAATARSGGATFGAMVQAADLRDGHDGAPTRWHDRPRNWRVFVQRQVCPGPFVIRAVAGHQPAGARLVEDDHVILVYRTLKDHLVYVDPGADAYEAKDRARVVRRLRQRAEHLGFGFVNLATGEVVEGAVS